MKSSSSNESLAKTPIISEEELPSYSETVDSPLIPTEENVIPIKTSSDTHQLPTGLAMSEFQASIEDAFKVAAESYFHGGAFARPINDTIHRVDTTQTTYKCDDAGDDVDSRNAIPAVDSNKTSSTTDVDLIRRPSTGGRRKSQSRICHKTSATGALFGTIWLRTTSVRVDSRSGKNFDVVSSFTFFPSWWLTKLGVNFGMEATLCETFAGWQFNFNPIRAVPDDSPIFRACKSGNLPAVQFLITDGTASVKDTNSKGWTPLHVSCQLSMAAIRRVSVYLFSSFPAKPTTL